VYRIMSRMSARGEFRGDLLAVRKHFVGKGGSHTRKTGESTRNGRGYHQIILWKFAEFKIDE
jgi:hypothetical protein